MQAERGLAAETVFPVAQYDLPATLISGQAFRWKQRGQNWESVIKGRWVSLKQTPEGIHASVAVPPGDWNWPRQYLQLEMDFPAVLSSFPVDEHLKLATQQCAGLRLLRQEPWECLASFILSST